MQGPATTSRRSEGPRAASLPDQRSSAWLSRGASAGVDLELPTPLLEERSLELLWPPISRRIADGSILGESQRRTALH
jgi:hypothetical protein